MMTKRSKVQRDRRTSPADWLLAAGCVGLILAVSLVYGRVSADASAPAEGAAPPSAQCTSPWEIQQQAIVQAQVDVRSEAEAALPPQTLQLGKDACESNHSLRPGDNLIVTLQGASGTGYVWEQIAGNPSVLTPLGPVAVQEGGGLGAQVTYSWYYQAGGGQTTLTLIWYRPSESGAPPAETCNITVKVQ